MTAPMVDYKIHWLKMMSVPESRAVVGRHDGINGRDKYLLEHPEVIKEAIQVLQAKRASREQDRARTALREHDKALRSHPMSPVSGQPEGRCHPR